MDKLLSPAQLGKVAVLMGGDSAEREVSLESGANVLAALQSQGVDAFAFDPQGRSLGELFRQKPDRIFMILHGQPGEDGRYQGVFDLHGIPYTGTGMLGSALTLDKYLSKSIWQNDGIPTPAFVVVDASMGETDKDYQKIAQALYGKQASAESKIVVKPANEGSSLGITIVKSASDWGKAMQAVRRFRGKVLAEAYIAGEEYTVGVVGEIALPTVAIRYQTEFYDYFAKYQDERTQLICPCGLPPEWEQTLQNLAIKSARPLFARGWFRADFIVTEEGQAYLLEINTAPGMTSHSLVPKAAGQYGWDYRELVLRIASLASFDATH